MLKLFRRVWFFATLWTRAHQAPWSMGFSRQEYWSGWLCPPLGDLPDLGTELASPVSYTVGRFFTHWGTCEALSFLFSSVTQLCSTLCDPMDCSMPGFPVHHQLLELAQTHVHQVTDAIQPSHPLSSPSPVFTAFQHKVLFQWFSSSHQLAKVLEFQLQHQSSQWINGLISFRIDKSTIISIKKKQKD